MGRVKDVVDIDKNAIGYQKKSVKQERGRLRDLHH